MHDFESGSNFASQREDIVSRRNLRLVLLEHHLLHLKLRIELRSALSCFVDPIHRHADSIDQAIEDIVGDKKSTKDRDQNVLCADPNWISNYERVHSFDRARLLIATTHLEHAE